MGFILSLEAVKSKPIIRQAMDKKTGIKCCFEVNINSVAYMVFADLWLKT